MRLCKGLSRLDGRARKILRYCGAKESGGRRRMRRWHAPFYSTSLSILPKEREGFLLFGEEIFIAEMHIVLFVNIFRNTFNLCLNIFLIIALVG